MKNTISNIVKQNIALQINPLIITLNDNLENIIPDKSLFGQNIVKYRNNTKNKINNYLNTPNIREKVNEILLNNNMELNEDNYLYVRGLIWNKLTSYMGSLKLSETICYFKDGQLSIEVILINNTPAFYIGFQSKNLINIWNQISKNNQNISAPIDYIIAHLLNIDISQYCKILEWNNGIRKHDRRKTDIKKFNLESSYLFKNVQDIRNAIDQLKL